MAGRHANFSCNAEATWQAIMVASSPADVSADNADAPAAAETPAPPASGRFAVDGKADGWVADFAEGEFKPDRRADLNGQGVTVVSATECRAPGWCGHGSTFRYVCSQRLESLTSGSASNLCSSCVCGLGPQNAKEDLWEESDHSADRVRKWTRIG